MQPWGSDFGAAMASLSSLVEAAEARRRANLASLATMTARLDQPDYTPSAEPEANSRPSHSTPPPMPNEPDPRDALPPAKKPYGDAILARVLASYGL